MPIPCMTNSCIYDCLTFSVHWSNKRSNMVLRDVKSAVRGWTSVTSGLLLFLIRRLSSYLRCSFDDKSGEIAGYGNTRIWFFSKKFIEMCAMWQQVFSCWNSFLNNVPWETEEQLEPEFSSLYFFAFMLPSMIWSMVPSL